MSKAKNLTMQEIGAQEAYEDVWALNTTEGDRRGNVFFTVPNPNGNREDQVIVPATWVPVNLTAQVTRKQLLESSTFRRAMSTGMLKIISNDDAQKILGEPGAREEADKVNRIIIGNVAEEAQAGMGRERPAVAAATTSNLSTAVATFIDMLDTVADNEALNSYRTMGRLRLEEMRAILRKAKDLGYATLGKKVAADIAEAKEAARNDEEDTMS
jgi:hypothetical protein